MKMPHPPYPPCRTPRTLAAVALLAVLVATGACSGPAAPAGTLNVFAAASLTEAFSEVGARFEAAHPGVKVVYNFAGSQQLAQQLAEGAPADVFASANERQMGAAIAAGRVVSGTSRVFARNRLVVIFPRDNPAGLSALQDLARPGVKVVLAAREVPAGQYALEFFDRAAQDPALGAGFRESALQNVVSYEQDVKTVLAKVALGEADAGIVYASDVTGAVGRLEIPDALNAPVVYPIAAVRDSARPDLAQAFVDLVLSPDGQAALARHNFLPAAP